MDHFIDADFEPGMGFLVDTLNDCIENRRYGFINKCWGGFRVCFIFVGLKKKRKAVEDLFGVSKKIRKLNVSLENLLLIENEEDGSEAVHVECASRKRQTRSSNKASKCKFGETQMDVDDEVDHVKPRKVMKRE